MRERRRLAEMPVRLYRVWIRLWFGSGLPRHRLEGMIDVLARALCDRSRTMRSRSVYALRAFGRAIVDGVHDRMRASGGSFSRREGGRMEGIGTEIRQALRQVRSRPLLAVVAVLCLSLGVGANTLLFSAVNAILLRPLPVPEPERLVRIFDPAARTSLRSAFSLEVLDALDRESSSMEGVLGTRAFRASVELPGESRLVGGELVTSSYFEVMGIGVERGRAFRPDEQQAGGGRVVILGDELAGRLEAVGVDPLGAEMRVNGHAFEVVGIAPAGFGGTRFMAPADLWVAVGARDAVGLPFAATADELEALGRLRTGVTLLAAAAELDAVRTAATGAPDAIGPEGGRFVLPERAGLINPARPGLVGAGAAAALSVSLLILLIACGNVGGLVLARAETRSGEMAVRTALGASRARLLRQLVVEGAVLAVPALAAGLWVAAQAGPFFAWLLPVLGDRPVVFALDARTLAYASLVGLLTILLTAAAPAVRVLRGRGVGPVHRGRGDIGGAGGRVLGGIVVGQVAVAAAVLLVAGYFGRTLSYYEAVDPGYETRGRIAFALDAAVGGMDPASAMTVLAELGPAIGSLPEVEAVALSAGVTAGGEAVDVEVPGEPRPLRVATNAVGHGYFDLMGIRLLHGDAAAWGGDAPDPAAVVVNETLAERLWSGRDPLGRTIRTADGAELRVVGVAGTIKHGALAAPDRPLLYRPFASRPTLRPTLLVRTSADTDVAVAAVRGRLAEIAPGVPIVSARTLADFVDEDRLLARAAARLGLGAGALCLLLSAVGLFGALTFMVRRRRAEIGIRLALGATPRGTLGGVLRGASGLVALGLALGVPVGLVLVRPLAGLLPGTRAVDVGLVAAVPLLVTLACALAVAVPAARAARMDPGDALRLE